MMTSIHRRPRTDSTAPAASPRRSRAAKTTAGAAIAAVVALPLGACASEPGDAVGPQGDRAPVAASTLAAEPAAEDATGAGQEPSAVDADGSAEGAADGGDSAGLASEYLKLRAAADADAAWAALSPTAQQTWTDRADFDAAVAQQAPGLAALLESDPTVVTTDVAGTALTTVSGVVDPAGTPRVQSASVLTGRLGVQEAAPASLPAVQWVNPTLEGAGSLGLAEHDPAAPLALRLGPGSTALAVVVDDEVVDAQQHVDQHPDGSTTVSVAAPPLEAGRHVVTVVHGYPGEVSGASTVVVEVS